MKKMFESKVKSKKAKQQNVVSGRWSVTSILLGVLFFLFTVHCTLSTVQAQTTDFSYQGILKSSGAPASGNFDFEFRLFDAAGGGTQQGPTNNIGNVAVVNGVYAVTLNFAAAAFNGGNRYLEISVRASGGGAFTQLTPRQQINSTPYAIRSVSAANANNALNAANFTGSLEGDVTGTQSATTIAANAVTNAKIADSAVTDPKIATGQVVKSINTLKDNVTLAAGSNITITPSGNTLTIASTGGGGGGGILNQTTLQTGANFNIDGTGTANIISATTQYNIGGSRVLSVAGTDNIFAGVGAGQANTTGFGNAFFGRDAGAANTIGDSNAFFGRRAGQSNTTGDVNAFFGAFAGQSNTEGGNNAFFGPQAGFSNTTGNSNAFFGRQAGFDNTTGFDNAFFGTNAGFANTTGLSNAFFGRGAGQSNTEGDDNAFFGMFAGEANTTGSDNAFFGRQAGFDNTEGGGNAFFGRNAGDSNTTGGSNTIIGFNADVGANNLTFATAIGSGAIAETSNRVQIGRDTLDTVRIGTLGAATMANLCIRPDNILASCSSSGRYKKNIEPLGSSLNLVQKLRPVTFDWKDRDERDLGLIAEEVAEIDPLLVTRNRNGEIQGVKYGQLSVVLINAVKEQQAQIEAQRKQIDAIKKLVCAQNPTADVCKEEK